MIEPTTAGRVAKAWRIPTNEGLAEAHRREFGYDHAGIDQWAIHGPYHPVWSWWYVGCVHLRPIEGAPPPAKHYPEAEYEFFIWSLEHEPDIEALRRGTAGSIAFLHPADVVFQFHGLTDAQAAELVELAVRKICDGQSCDSDYRGWWEDTLRVSVGHIIAGAH